MLAKLAKRYLVIIDVKVNSVVSFPHDRVSFTICDTLDSLGNFCLMNQLFDVRQYYISVRIYSLLDISLCFSMFLRFSSLCREELFVAIMIE